MNVYGMNVYVVTVRNAVGREREVRVVASNEQSACSQAVLRVTRETGAPKGDWQAVKTLPA